MKQVHLKRKNREQIVWVDDHPKIKKGNSLSFKDATKDVWDILDVWEKKMDKQKLHKNWDVGGL